MARYPNVIKRALNEAEGDTKNFPEWLERSVERMWVNHSKMHGALFDHAFVPYLAEALECAPRDLFAIYSRSQDPQIVASWVKCSPVSEEVKLARRAYVLSAIVRGRYHEHIASDSERPLQLIHHPLRELEAVRTKLPAGPGKPVLPAEQYFIRMSIGSALLERDERKCITVWLQNIERARAAILAGSVALPDTACAEEAEEAAAACAVKVGTVSTSRRARVALELAVNVGIGILVTVSISPWLAWRAPVAASALHMGYKTLRGRTLGEDMAGLALDTRRRFRLLGRSLPGRIERNLREENLPS
jgi:hypothetical protein